MINLDEKVTNFNMVSNDLHIKINNKQGNDRLPDPCWWVRLGGGGQKYI